MKSLLTAIVVLALCGCANVGTVQPAPDPVVVQAEQVAEIAAETIDGFIHYEWMHRNALWKLSPDFKRVADHLRGQSAPTLRGLRAATLAYKADRTEANRKRLVTELAVVRAMLARTEDIFARAIAENVTP